MNRELVLGCAAVVGLCAHVARADVAETKAYLDGTTLKLDVKSGETLNYSTLLADTGATAIEKNGLGKAYFNYGVSVTNSFAGTITIKAGTLGATSLDNYGTPVSITIESGASLDLTQAAGAPGDPRLMYDGMTKLYFEGTGSGSYGAIYRNGGGGGADHLFRNMEMTGDALIGGPTRWGLGGDSNGRLDMNGHTLTLSATGFLLDNFTILDPGHIDVIGGSTVLQNGGLKLSGGATNELRMLGGSLSTWNIASNAAPWTLVVGKNGEFSNSSGADFHTYNMYSGDVVHTNGTLGLKVHKENIGLTFLGNFLTTDLPDAVKSSAGPYVKINEGIAAAGTVRFLGNTWTNAMTHGASSECLEIYNGAFEFAGKGPHLMDRIGVHNTNTWFHDCGYIEKTPRLSWFIESARSASSVRPACLKMERLGFYSQGGSLTIANSGTNNWGTFCIGDGAFVTGAVQMAYNGLAALHVKDGGFLRWTDGHVSNNYNATNRITSAYVLVDGGRIERANNINFGENGRALYLQRTGSYQQTGGRFCPHTLGDTEVVIAGGTFSPVPNVETGDWQGFEDNAYRRQADALHPPLNTASLTVSGDGAVSVGNYVFNATNGLHAVFTLRDGGTFSCRRMYNLNKAKCPNVRWDLGFDGGVLKPKLGWVFFTIADDSRSPHAVTVYNGGAIFDTDETQKEIGGDGHDYGSDCHFGAPLLAPTGKSIKSISLPTTDEFAAANLYNVPPRVRINGTGHAATAIADLDDVTGKVKGIIVTSPGYGYDDTTTVTIDAWNQEKTFVCGVVLEEQRKGGLTKRGKNGLVLYSAESTFTGDITIEGGYLMQNVAGAIPSGRTVNLASGELNLNGQPLSVNKLTGFGSITSSGAATLTVTGGVEVAAADVLDGKKINVYSQARLAFESGTKIAVTGFAEAIAGKSAAELEALRKGKFDLIVMNNALPAGAYVPEVIGLPDGWRARLSADRKTFRIGAERGLMVVVH